MTIRMRFFLIVAGLTLALWYFLGGFGILIMWLILCVIGAFVFGSAASLTHRLGNDPPQAPVHARFYGALSLLFLVLAWSATRAMENYSGGIITPVQAGLTTLVFLVTFTGIDVAVTLQARPRKEPE